MFKWWVRLSLTSRVLVVTSAVLIAGYSAAAYLLVSSQIGIYRNTVLKETKLRLDLTAAGIKEHAVTGDYAAIEQMLRVWAGTGHYLEVDYTDSTGNTISITQPQEAASYPKWFKKWVGVADRPESRQIVVGGQDYGGIQVWLSHVGFVNSLWRAVLQQLALATLMGVVLLVLFMFVIRRGLSPLTEVRRVAASIEEGKHQEVVLPRGAAPEIVDTIVTFNKATVREAWLVRFLDITAMEASPRAKVEAVLAMLVQQLSLTCCTVSCRDRHGEFVLELSVPRRPPWATTLWVHWLDEVIREKHAVLRSSTTSLIEMDDPLKVYFGVPLQIGAEQWGVLSLFGADLAVAERIRAHMSLLDLCANWVGVALSEDMHERQLREQKERAEAVLGSVYEGIVMLDEMGDVLSCNPAVAQIFGLAEERVCGQWLGQLIPDGLFSHGQHLISEVSAELGETGNTLCTGLRQDGRRFPLEISLRTIKDSEPPMYVAVFRDITDRIESEMALRHGEARLRRAQHLARIGEWQYSRATGKITWSPESLDVFGASSEIADTHERVLSMVHPEDRDLLLQSVAKAAASGTSARLEFRLRGPDGVTRHLDLLGEISREPGKMGNLYGVIQDITTRKFAEAKAHSALVDQLRAEARNRAKSQFLANMSHELRTPLNAILGYSEMLEEDARAQGLTTMLADLEKIRGAGRHLLTLISDILDLSKIEAGRMTLSIEEFPIPALLDEVAQTMEPLMMKNQNQLRVICDGAIGTVRADITRLRQALFNLIGNAAKFSNHGIVDLRVEKVVQDGRELLAMHVTDSGIGMTVDQMTHLFEPFMQADASTTRKYGGTGLGLAISRHFCLLMGGDITVESEEGKGSTFTIWLPTTVVTPAAETDRSAGDASLKPVSLPMVDRRQQMSTVLVVDDDPAICELLTHLLNSVGVRVVTALNSTEALRIARAERPDVILLDILMPAPDGWAVMRSLKAEPTMKDTPIIMLTTEAVEDTALALGAADFIRKPIDLKQLVDTVKKWLRRGPANSVLVVDDDPLHRAFVSSVMRAERWNVREAEDGMAALEQIRREMPTLILLDINMPRMNGEEFVEKLCVEPGSAKPLIIALTGSELSEEARYNLAGRVTRFVLKGDDMKSDLRAAIDDALKSAAAIQVAA